MNILETFAVSILHNILHQYQLQLYRLHLICVKKMSITKKFTTYKVWMETTEPYLVDFISWIFGLFLGTKPDLQSGYQTYWLSFTQFIRSENIYCTNLTNMIQYSILCHPEVFGSKLSETAFTALCIKSICIHHVLNPYLNLGK